jgi:hypothetical protein
MAQLGHGVTQIMEAISPQLMMLYTSSSSDRDLCSITRESVNELPHPVAADYAVDGNTDGEFLNSSTIHTSYKQGAWWQVDLGSQKNIKQIIIYNRTDQYRHQQQ